MMTLSRKLMRMKLLTSLGTMLHTGNMTLWGRHNKNW